MIFTSIWFHQISWVLIQVQSPRTNPSSTQSESLVEASENLLFRKQALQSIFQTQNYLRTSYLNTVLNPSLPAGVAVFFPRWCNWAMTYAGGSFTHGHSKGCSQEAGKQNPGPHCLMVLKHVNTHSLSLLKYGCT